MCRGLLLFALLLSVPLHAAAQSTPRVLVVGDSWAEEMWGDGSHEVVFVSNNVGHYTALGATTTDSGTTAAQWKQPARLQLIADALQANPSVDIVQLTVGGNDFLNAWSTSMPPMQVDALKLQILEDLEIITAFILNQRPDIELLLSFYDYPNFRDTLTGSIVASQFCQPLWNDLGQPSPAQLNAAAIDFVDTYAQIAAAHPRIHHVRHFGLMQNKYGIDDIPAGQLAMPGDPSRPSPVQSMRARVFIIPLGRDCFHLTPQGYDHLVQNLYEGYYAIRFETILRSSFE